MRHTPPKAESTDAPTSRKADRVTTGAAATREQDAEGADVLSRGRRWLVAGLTVPLFALAIAVLHRELSRYHYHDIITAVRAIPTRMLLASVACTAVSYCMLALGDVLALRYVRSRVALRRVVFAAFIASAFSQSLGMPVLTGGSVRYRFWTTWRMSAATIARAIVFVVVTFWLGALTVLGIILVIESPPPALQHALHVRTLAPLGVLALLAVIGYVGVNVRRTTPLRVRSWALPMPGVPLALMQVLIASADWTASVATAFAVMPPTPGLGFAAFAGIFLCAQVAGLASHLPGGIGVFETVMLLLLRSYMPGDQIVGSLVLYRAVYYLLPLLTAVTLFVAHEVARHWRRVAGLTRVTSAWISPVVPSVLAVATFASGLVLLVSGATPPVHSRLDILDGLLPLAVIELSHFAGSVAGTALVLLAWAIYRRLDAAYALGIALLGVGIGASLLKGLDWEEATLLVIALAALLPSRRYFYRKSAIAAEALTPQWIAALAIVIGTTLWLGAFSYKHIDYSADLWWQFSLRGDGPRFLRASVGMIGTVFVFATAHLLRHAPVQPELPSPPVLAQARAVIARARNTSANLALVGDKSLLFSAAGDAFVMYGVAGRSWVAMGDPVGPPAQSAELAWQFHELADRHGGRTVFYEVHRDNLPIYIDLGLSLLKLGEEAVVDLKTFSLDGGERRALRRAHRDALKRGASFEFVDAEALPALLPMLTSISHDWLESKHTREKGFSLGRFDPAYLTNFPAALVRIDGKIVAFTNVWRGANQHELSVDLIRFAKDAPSGMMDYLFIELMRWGRTAGYATFTLGMAPLSGLQSRQLAPLWSRAGALLYRHGEHFYNFRGLRQYKEKFDPAWTPRYLASPGGLALPRVLANVATLISGGLRGVVTR
jgi:phosphatidylglycerol lysyltransferase